MPWYLCENCGKKSYSAAPLHWLRDPNCSRCGGELIELSKEEGIQIRFKDDSVNSKEPQKSENKAEG